MNDIKKLVLSIIIFLTSTTISHGENRIAYIDIDLILSKTNASISFLNQLKVNEENVLSDLKIKEKKLKDEESKILNKKNIISKDEFSKNVSEFKLKIKEYNLYKNDIIIKLEKKRSSEIIRFLKKINPIIEDSMKNLSIGILIEKKNIFIAKSNYDITPIIIKSVNEKISEFIIE